MNVTGGTLHDARRQRHRATSQDVTAPRIYWPVTSQGNVTGGSRAQPVTYVSPVGGYVTGATSPEHTSKQLAGRTSPRNTDENEAA